MWGTASTRQVALLGDPVAHSLSPAVHNAAFRALGLDLVYLACRVGADGLADALKGLHAMGAAGANVTVPHKEAAAALAVDLAPAAEATGAVNTLIPSADGWLGENTDVDGFLAPLRGRESAFAGSSVVVFGAGGAARAVVYAALTTLAPARVTIVGRSPDRSRRLAGDLSSYDPDGVLTVVAPERAGPWVREAALVVNASSAGMTPDVDATPWNGASDFGEHQLVYDVVYAPAPTRMLLDASARGAETIDGREMLLGQAAASFRLWTGRDMPMAEAREALLAAGVPAT